MCLRWSYYLTARRTCHNIRQINQFSITIFNFGGQFYSLNSIKINQVFLEPGPTQ